MTVEEAVKVEGEAKILRRQRVGYFKVPSNIILLAHRHSPPPPPKKVTIEVKGYLVRKS